ncbi:MAG: glycosyltransferase family 4 protein [Anaerolineae bacterium]|nr:glycosyltransferase family 4 protein [Anaerolineae bacterium]
MKLLLIADGRSPITRRWIAMLAPLNYELVLISSYPCEPISGLDKHYVLPLAFASQGGSQAGTGTKNLVKQLVSRFRPLAQRIRHLLGPWTLSKHIDAYLDILKTERPDLLHAFRIPFEGMLAASTPLEFPLILSTWGNDFTLHASSTGRMESMTRKALRRADALMSDTQCDLQRAQQWGFDPQKPCLVVPGNGGTDVDELTAITKIIERADPAQVINPRGLRSYVRTDTFFKAIPLVLAKKPDVQFVCASMEGQAEAVNWVTQLGIEKNVRFLPYVSQPELWREYAKSQVMVSNSTHDGSPNSLLEAMALGCFPICGDIQSIREWITDGVNGLLVDPANPGALAEAILHALDNTDLRASAAKRNALVIRERAGIQSARNKVKEFYEQLV